MDHLTPSSPLPIRTVDRLTPRGNPNYDIYFSDGKIKSVVEKCLRFVTQDEMEIEHLPSGKSFNNRIYFISLKKPHLNTRPEWSDKSVEVTKSTTQIQSSFLVLKIAGHPFGLNKVQNEVACLLLMEKYCPSIPCPKLIAWSDDGKKVRTPEYPRGFRDTEVKNVPVLALQTEDGIPIEDARKDTEGQGWMLLTREPGKPIDPEEISGKGGEELMRQIAVHVATWRKNMPPAHSVGNLRIVGSGTKPGPAGDLYDKAILPGYDIHIEGLITNSSPSSPLGSAEKYIAFALKNAIRKLKEGEQYGDSSAEVQEMIRRFVDVSLAKLPMFRVGAETMVFSHCDLSTRNVLVVPHGNGSVKVSSIIDFEFAGFFPKDEEFANCLQNDNLEWPLKKYASFLAELKEHEALPDALAVKIPSPSSLGNASDKAFEFGTSDFHQATLLLRMCINAVPWWIGENKDMTPEAIVCERAAAKARVADAIAFLESCIPITPEKNGRRSRGASSASNGTSKK
jgi:hypothetical protein